MKKYSGLIVVIILSLFPLINLLSPGLPITHDGTDHVARIANFYRGLTDGVIFPRWAENLNWSYGHPVLMFLYPFSSYMASLFHFLGFSYVDSLKIVFASGFTASGVAMYLWAKKQFGNPFAVAASVLYLYAPYRFVDLYVRGAIGEHMAFIFPPLILYCICSVFEKNSNLKLFLYASGTAIFTSMLLLSHNAISIMFLPVIFLYILSLSYKNKDYKKFFILLISIIWGFLLSSFFTVPAFLEGKFTLRDIVTGDEYKTRFVEPIKLLYGPWNYGITGQFTTQVGIIHLIGTLVTFLLLIFGKLKRNKLFFLFLFFFLISLFLMTNYSMFVYQIITVFEKFQFPWRFLTLSVFTSSILAPGIILIVKNNKNKIVICFLISIFAILATITYWHAKDYKIITDSFYNRIYEGTTDTGESAPIWSVRFMEKKPVAPVEIIEGKAVIIYKKRSSVLHEYTVNVLSEKARVRENTLYFPGWNVFVNGKKSEIQFQDPSNRGLITYFLNKGNNKINVEFKDTKVRVISNITSILSMTMLLLLGFAMYLNEKKQKK